MAIDFNSLYQQNLGRAPDAGGLSYWQGLSNSGMSDADLKNSFFADAAKEMQKNDTGLDANTDAWDEKRIAGAMQLYDSTPALSSIGGYYNAAGDTATTSAAQRLGGFSIDKLTNGGYNNSLSQPAPQPMPQPVQQNLGLTSGYTKNPYLDDMAAGITSQMNDNWTRNFEPSIRSGAMAAGGYGGSRQGVVEANGLNDMNRSLGQNLSNLYGTDYTNAQNRNLQQQSINNSYDLGLRSSDLGFANLDANIANSNFSNQLNSANFGLNAYNTMNGQTQAGTSAGAQIQNTPLDYQKYFTNSANGVGSGYGTSTSSQTNPGNTALGFLGGAQLGSQIYNQYK
jgi:hypothetical protein